MKEISAYQNNPAYGPMTIIMRIEGKIVFLKSNNNQQKNNMIKQMRNNGAEIVEGNRGWIRINMFKNNPQAKLGVEYIDIEEDTNEQIEAKLTSFYTAKYVEAKFTVDVKEL